MLMIRGKIKQLLTAPRMRLLQRMFPHENQTYLLYT